MTGQRSTQAVDAVVVGQGLPALLAAWELAEVGLQVAIVGEAADLDEAPQRDPEGVLAAVLERLAAPIEGTDGVADPGSAPRATVLPAPLLLDRTGAWAPQSEPSVLGIPASPLSVETIQLLGSGSATRAYLDRVTPLLTIGKTRELGTLVRRRIGAEALSRLVEPQVRERFGVAASEVDVAIAAPGFNETLSRAGSLTSAALAYSERNVARETVVVPSAGWAHAVQALQRRLVAYNVIVHDSPALSCERHGPDTWQVQLENGAEVLARAVVIELPRWQEAHPNSVHPAAIGALEPQRVRTHADIDIHPPRDMEGSRPAVRTIGEWALRIGAAETGSWSARLSGPVAMRGALPGISTAELDQFLSDAGLRAAEGAEWRIRATAAAFATVAARREAAERLDAVIAEQPDLLPVGQACFGDELAAAAAAVGPRAVSLRRHLLGLSD